MENAIFTDAAERSAAINLKSKDAPEDLLTKEYVELLTSPLDLAAYEGAATEAMFKGSKRNVESENEGSLENAQAGGRPPPR